MSAEKFFLFFQKNSLQTAFDLLQYQQQFLITETTLPLYDSCYYERRMPDGNFHLPRLSP